MNDAIAFLTALARYVPEGQRMLVVGVQGEPTNKNVAVGCKKPVPWTIGDLVPFPLSVNGYATVSSFVPAPDGAWVRRSPLFGAGLALLVDDLGPKAPMSLVDRLRPTALVETSEDNFQGWWMFDRALQDAERFNAMIQAMAAVAGIDDALSVTRIARLPEFTNCKPSAHGFRCRLHWLEADRRYSPDKIIAAFGLLLAPRRSRSDRSPPPAAMRELEEDFNAMLRVLKGLGMIKPERPHADPDREAVDMQCPWIGEHTDRADSGAALFPPSEKNCWMGGFKCFHGHCAHRSIRDVKQWTHQRTEEILQRNNMRSEDAYATR